MANNEIRTGKKSNGEFAVTYQQNGYGGCTPVIDGKPEPSLTFGYVSESDKQACMKLLEEAIKATGGDIWKVQRYIMNAVRVSAAEIKADEAVTVDDYGTEIIISYQAKKAYQGTEEIANLDDITCELPNEAIKAMLTDRAKLRLEEIARDQREWDIFFSDIPDDDEDEDDEDVIEFADDDEESEPSAEPEPAKDEGDDGK